MDFQFLKDNYDINKKAFDFVEKACIDVLENARELDSIKEYNQIKVLNSLKKSSLSQSDFSYATGYGYGDRGREKTEEIFATVFNTEDSLVRPSISSGTHALSITLFSMLSPGDTLLSITGHPYDTLQEVIGITGSNRNTLKSKGINYDYIPLIGDKINLDSIQNKINNTVRLVLIQRSTGYGLRKALTVDEIAEAIKVVKGINPEIVVMVDNCYGEFTEINEPTDRGADLCVGSLIKNPGGAIAQGGGYIVGKKELIEDIADHFYAPGIGKEIGLTYDTTRSTLQGLFFAPHITNEAMKSALLFCKVYSDLGFDTFPNYDDKRSDIIQSIVFNDREKLITFVQAIQMAASVGSTVVPYPWDMPGYDDEVIMASGGFIDGSSIELSADGPLREPYAAYYQGGVVFEQAKLACMITLSKLEEKNLIQL